MIKFRDRNASYATSSIGQATGSMYHTGGAKKLTRVPFRPWEIAPLWIENVAREEATRKKWENMYGWLADYDAKVIIFTTKTGDRFNRDKISVYCREILSQNNSHLKTVPVLLTEFVVYSQIFS